MRNKALLIISSISLIVFLVVSVYYLIINRNKADPISEPTVIKGTVYLNSNSGPVAPNADVLIITDSDICKIKQYSTTSDQNGFFEIKIDKPYCKCPYKIIVGGNGDYNAHDNGSINFGNQGEMPGMGWSDMSLVTDNVTQAMHSSYPSLSGVYTSGYHGSYHLSQWDTHFLRNPVSVGTLINPTAPSSAEFEIDITKFNSAFAPMPNMEDKFINIELYTLGCMSDHWIHTTNWSPYITGTLDKKTISLNMKTGEIVGDTRFSVDLSSLSSKRRYNVYKNGFMIDFNFAETDQDTLEWWRDANPDLILPLDGSTVSYSGFEDLNNNICSVSWPTKSHRVTSKFGMRLHPIKKEWRFHNGIDIADGSGWAYNGAKVYAAGNGIVTGVGSAGAYGLRVTVKHCDNITTTYNHLLTGSVVVNVGDYVTVGQHIADVDHTGWSTAPHLHFSVFKNGEAIDPLSCLPD